MICTLSVADLEIFGGGNTAQLFQLVVGDGTDGKAYKKRYGHNYRRHISIILNWQKIPGRPCPLRGSALVWLYCFQ